MRVIQLARYGGPYPGSFIAMVRALRRVCAQRGWDCEAVFSPEAEERAWLPELGAEMPVRTLEPARRPGAIEAILAERADEPTLLHTHFTGFDLAAAASARGREHTGVVWHLHTRLSDGPAAFARNAVKFAAAGRRVDRIVCAGPDIAKNAARRLAPRDRLVSFPNGIDVERFPLAGPDERRAAKAALGAPVDRPLLLHFGWDWTMKGGDLFVRAAAELASGGIDLFAVSIGAPEAEARASDAAVSLDGALAVRPSSDDVRSLYAAADVLVMSSPVEGSPFSVVEALATGTPVVTSPRADAQVDERIAACRVVERTPSAFAAAIRETLERPQATALVERDEARAYLESERDLSAWAGRMADLYASAMAGR